MGPAVTQRMAPNGPNACTNVRQLGERHKRLLVIIMGVISAEVEVGSPVALPAMVARPVRSPTNAPNGVMSVMSQHHQRQRPANLAPPTVNKGPACNTVKVRPAWFYTQGGGGGVVVSPVLRPVRLCSPVGPAWLGSVAATAHHRQPRPAQPCHQEWHQVLNTPQSAGAQPPPQLQSVRHRPGTPTSVRSCSHPVRPTNSLHRRWCGGWWGPASPHGRPSVRPPALMRGCPPVMLTVCNLTCRLTRQSVSSPNAT